MQIAKPVTKPAKQRKALFQAPNHRRHKLFAATLSPNLRSTHGIRAFPVRSGDTVRIMRGDHEGFEGKVSRIDLMKYRVYVEGLTREKVDGTTIFVPVHPSKVMITNLNLDDKWRAEILKEKKAQKKVEKVEEKPAKKPSIKTAVTKEEKIEKKVPARGKPREKKVAGRKKATAGKTTAKKKEELTEELPKPEKKPRVRKAGVKRKATNKTEGET
jgi:large subunit ribosomal protein L24